ncbi:MAG TPA: BamA/TamA family outer membrane protein [Gemmatimonadales bacterium]|jgi:outer membrane protein assembly factor BamA|nr:BamA/TamA family outer membrane protein [Gemmatimonadales bacterium]
MAPRRGPWIRRTCTKGPLRAVSATLALLTGVAPTLGAQRYWRDNFYPYAYYSTIDGLWGAVHYGRYSPVGFVERPEPHLAAITLDAGASTQGSYAVLFDARAPAWWDGWRAALTLGVTRDNRLGYYGLGNATQYAPDSVAGGRPYFYKVSRARRAARATLERRAFGPVRLLAGVTLAHTDFRALPGPSVFARDLAAGTVDPSTVPFSDQVVRAGVVLDTRDHEVDPHTGVLAELLFASGTGYTRTTAAASVQVHPVKKLILAGRLAAERMGGTPPLAAEQEMESSERPFGAVGGYHSLRGYYDGRFVGPGKLLGGLEARYAVVWAPSVLELKLVAFYDAGRVFGPGEALRLTTSGLHRGGGGELALRVLRNSLLVVGYGRGSEGGQLLFGTTWSY